MPPRQVTVQRANRPIVAMPRFSARASATLLLLLACVSLLQAADFAAFRPDRLLIIPRQGISENSISLLHQRRGHRILRKFDWMRGLQVVQLSSRENAPEAIRRYRESGLVELAEPDYKLHALEVPNDPELLNGTQWSLYNDIESNADIHALEGWETMHDATNIVVAIIDSGIRYTHQDLSANIWTNSAEIPNNGIDDDHNGIVDDVYGLNALTDSGNPMDDNGHGSHVAGIVGAVGNNGIGTTGVAWKLQLMACKFLDSTGNGDTSDAIQCIDYARKMGAYIINASWGGSQPSTSLSTAIEAARNAGIIFVTAAGNDARNLDISPIYPAAFNIDNIVTVCATSSDDTFAGGYSNFSSTKAHIAAPGSLIYSTWFSSDSAYSKESGTSMAAPCVAGVCALLKARYPADNERQIIERLLNSVDPLPSLVGKCSTGGRVNLAKALGPNPQSAFSVSTLGGEPPLTVLFTNTSYGDLKSMSWDFGDHSPLDPTANPAHAFLYPGKFNVSLTVIGLNGKTNSTSREIVVDPAYDISTNSFAWKDPSGMTALDLQDSNTVAQPLPFSFHFFGKAQDTVFISDNGLIGFNPLGMTNPVSAQIPSLAFPNEIIAPYWDNLDPTLGGTIFFGIDNTSLNRRAVISWLGVPRAGSSVALSFQVIIEENTDSITFQYLEVHPESSTGGGKRACIGLENSNGSSGLFYSFRGIPNGLLNNTALTFSPKPFPYLIASSNAPLIFSGPAGLTSAATRIVKVSNPGNADVLWQISSTVPWLKASIENGTLHAGESTNVILSLDLLVAPIFSGNYEGLIRIENLTDGAGGGTFPVSLLLTEPLQPQMQVSTPDIKFVGNAGGPFLPDGITISVTNSGAAPLNWRVTTPVEWATLTPSASTLEPGEGTNVLVTLNQAAGQLSPQLYYDEITFENLDNHIGDTLLDLLVDLHKNPVTALATVVNGELSGTLSVPSEGSYMIELSEDLRSWTELRPVQSLDGKVSFTVPISGGQYRFYRWRQL
jgi:subtilisin family serine protease